MVAASLIAAVSVEEPGLIFAQILIIDGLLSGSHNALISKVEIVNTVFRCGPAEVLLPAHPGG